jgi:HK97 gp10 family phage protein
MGMRLEGGKDLPKKLKKIADKAASNMEAAVISGALLVQNDAKENAPYKTGDLRGSIHVEPMISGKDETIVKVGPSVIYGRIQEYGGTIRTKNAPWLVFRTADGNWHKVKSVEIPAHPYLRPAFDGNKDKVEREIRRALKRLNG